MIITAAEYEPVSESDNGEDENPLILTSSSDNEVIDNNVLSQF